MMNFFKAFNEAMDRELRESEGLSTELVKEDCDESIMSEDMDVDKVLFNDPLDKMVFDQAKELTGNENL